MEIKSPRTFKNLDQSGKKEEEGCTNIFQSTKIREKNYHWNMPGGRLQREDCQKDDDKKKDAQER